MCHKTSKLMSKVPDLDRKLEVIFYTTNARYTQYCTKICKPNMIMFKFYKDILEIKNP